MMVVDSAGLTDTMADREWPSCLAKSTIIRRRTASIAQLRDLARAEERVLANGFRHGQADGVRGGRIDGISNGRASTSPTAPAKCVAAHDQCHAVFCCAQHNICIKAHCKCNAHAQGQHHGRARPSKTAHERYARA